MNSKKILYFDYWTIGIKNFQRFDGLLRKRGCETKLFHLASWKNIDAPFYQSIGGINCYDIKHYNTNSIFKVLKSEMPNAVVMLNCSQTTDRTVILACKKLGIKSVYLMHGSLTREDFIEESVTAMNQVLKQNRIKRALKHIKSTVWNYLESLIRYDWRYIFCPYGYKVLFQTFSDPATYLNFPPPSFDLTPNLSLVYGQVDKEYYRKKFLDPRSIIQVVGNPDLDSFFSELGTISHDRDSFLISQRIPANRPYIVYVEEGLVEDKIWDNDSRITFIKEVSEACADAGFYLVIKLHPRTSGAPNRHTISDTENVTILDQTNFAKLVFFSDKVISHYSTTLIYPILLDKPILIPRWGKSASLQTIYERDEVTFIHTIEEFGKSIKQTKFNYHRGKYLNGYVPYSDGKTSERIAENILDVTK